MSGPSTFSRLRPTAVGTVAVGARRVRVDPPRQRWLRALQIDGGAGDRGTESTRGDGQAHPVCIHCARPGSSRRCSCRRRSGRHPRCTCTARQRRGAFATRQEPYRCPDRRSARKPGSAPRSVRREEVRCRPAATGTEPRYIEGPRGAARRRVRRGRDRCGRIECTLPQRHRHTVGTRIGRRCCRGYGGSGRDRPPGRPAWRRPSSLPRRR